MSSHGSCDKHLLPADFCTSPDCDTNWTALTVVNVTHITLYTLTIMISLSVQVYSYSPLEQPMCKEYHTYQQYCPEIVAHCSGASSLQVLLSQVHRLRALVLLGRFLDMGRWAVDLALSVGIFPYVLKLLQTTALDLRQTLVFIWTKILALDRSCQVLVLPLTSPRTCLACFLTQYLAHLLLELPGFHPCTRCTQLLGPLLPHSRTQLC